MTLLPAAQLERSLAVLARHRPIAVYAFGSRAAGEARPDSDLDLAVLLPAGASITMSERLGVVDKLQHIVGVDVDLVILNEARLPVRFEIIRHGTVLWESSFDERTDAEDLIVRDYLDFRPFLERSFRDLLGDTPRRDSR